MKKFIQIAALLSILLVFNQAGASSKNTDVMKLGDQVIASAFAKLTAANADTDMACLTNAGYVTYRGQSTRMLYDLLSEKAGISLGRGNLLPVHTCQNASLWFAFVKKKSEKELFMTYIETDENVINGTDPINVYVDKQQSFEPFKKILGKKNFSLVTIANGWADGIPEYLMRGSLFHDHLCCGVFTGYFTINFIKKNLGLRQGEKYIYIGAPPWCQDDHIIGALNSTPGKHGYYAMDYPWYRPWKTRDKTYEKLGGIIIRFNNSEQSGQASLLSFDWKEDEFKKFIGIEDIKFDWKNQPWLHVWYNRFFLSHLDQLENFVSILANKDLNNRNDLDRLIKLGANPLEEILGPDKEWMADIN